MDKKMLFIVVGATAIVGIVAGYGVSRVGHFNDARFAARTMNGAGVTNTVRNNQRNQSGQFNGRGDRQGSGVGMMDGSGRGMGLNRQNCVADGCLAVDGLDYPAGTLSDAAKQALGAALADEYTAYAAYDAIIAKQGDVRPFIMIRRAEEQHISMLKALFDKYGVAIPENQSLGKVAAPETLQASCQMGVDAEIANASLYRDQLLPAVKDYPDITAVFTNLMNASQNNHLPAFDRCN
jgi:hypothetical protein